MSVLPAATRNSPRIVGHRRGMPPCVTASALLRLSPCDSICVALNSPYVALSRSIPLSSASVFRSAYPSSSCSSCRAVCLSERLAPHRRRAPILACDRQKKKREGTRGNRGTCPWSSQGQLPCQRMLRAPFATPLSLDQRNTSSIRLIFPLSACFTSSSAGWRASSPLRSFKPILGPSQNGSVEFELSTSLSAESRERLLTLPLDQLLALPLSSGGVRDRSETEHYIESDLDGACRESSPVHGKAFTSNPEGNSALEFPDRTESGHFTGGHTRENGQTGMKEGDVPMGSIDSLGKAGASSLTCSIPSHQVGSLNSPTEVHSAFRALPLAPEETMQSSFSHGAKVLVLEETGELEGGEDINEKGLGQQEELPSNGDEAEALDGETARMKKTRWRLSRRNRPIEDTEDFGRWPRTVSLLFTDPVDDVSSADIQGGGRGEYLSPSHCRLEGEGPGRRMVVGSLLAKPSGYVSPFREIRGSFPQVPPVRDQSFTRPSGSSCSSSSVFSRSSIAAFESSDSLSDPGSPATPGAQKEVCGFIASTVKSTQAADEVPGRVVKQLLTPLEKLRMHRSRREFEAADHVLRLQALTTPRHGVPDDRSSSQREAFLWRRATRQLSQELRRSLSSSALRDVIQAIVAGQHSGLQGPPPQLLVGLFKEVSKKVIYWSLEDLMGILHALSSLFQPMHPDHIRKPPHSPSSSRTRDSYDTLLEDAKLTNLRMEEETKYSLDLAFHQDVSPLDWPGTLGPSAAYVFHVILQRLLESSDRLDALEITTVLQTYARMGILSSESLKSLLDALYRCLVGRQRAGQSLRGDEEPLPSLPSVPSAGLRELLSRHTTRSVPPHSLVFSVSSVMASSPRWSSQLISSKPSSPSSTSFTCALRFLAQLTTSFAATLHSAAAVSPFEEMLMENVLACHFPAAYQRHAEYICKGKQSYVNARSREHVAASLPVRLMSRMLQHVAGDVLLKLPEAQEERRLGRREAKPQEDRRWISGKKNARLAAAARVQEGKPVFPPLVLSQLLYTLSLLDFYTSHRTPAEIQRAAGLFKKVKSILRPEELVTAGSAGGRSIASSVVGVVAALSIQTHLQSATGGACDGKGMTPCQGGGDCKKPSNRSDAAQMDRPKTGQLTAADSFLICRLLRVALPHASTLSLQQHSVLLECLCVHLGFHHDFILDVLRATALSAASSSLGSLLRKPRALPQVAHGLAEICRQGARAEPVSPQARYVQLPADTEETEREYGEVPESKTRVSGTTETVTSGKEAECTRQGEDTRCQTDEPGGWNNRLIVFRQSSSAALAEAGDMDSSRLLRSVDTAWAVVRLLAVLVNQHPLLALPALAEGHAVFGAATHVLGAAYASPQTALGSVDHRTALAEPARIARRRLLALMLSTLLLRIKGPSAQPKTGIQRDRTPGHEVEPGTCKTHENLVVQMAGGEASKAMRVQAVASAWESDEKHCLPEQQGKQIHGERPTLPRKPLWCHSAPGDLQRPPLCFLERELKNPWALSSQLEEIAQYSEQLLTAVTV